MRSLFVTRAAIFLSLAAVSCKQRSFNNDNSAAALQSSSREFKIDEILRLAPNLKATLPANLCFAHGTSEGRGIYALWMGPECHHALGKTFRASSKYLLFRQHGDSPDVIEFVDDPKLNAGRLSYEGLGALCPGDDMFPCNIDFDPKDNSFSFSRVR